MQQVRRPVNRHKAYHAHVYFDETTLVRASELFHEAGAMFGVKVGRVHQKVIAPHTRWSCQITFGQRDFQALVPWLDEHRKGLSILIHGLTGDELADHTDYAYWLGDRVALDLKVFGG